MSGAKTAARQLNYLLAVREAQLEEMRRDDTVFIMGEDIETSLFGTTEGFVEEFGLERIRNTPISEEGFAGAAIGAALTGMRPIVDFTIASFLYMAVDQFVSQAAKSRYMFGGQARIPIVFRSTMFYSQGYAAHHSDRPYPMFMTVPGLKIVTPSSPYDVKGLLKTAIRDDNPVMFFEDQTVWSLKEEVPEEEYLIPFGVAAIKRAGDDVTVVAVAGAVPLALRAAETLAEEQISVEVIDPRTLVPLDWPTILESAGRTGRLVVVDPAHKTCSAASEIVATASEELYGSLLAAPRRVTAPDMQIPFSPSLFGELFPSEEKIVAAVHAVMEP